LLAAEPGKQRQACGIAEGGKGAGCPRSPHPD
jgi:hypothetical protein